MGSEDEQPEQRIFLDRDTYARLNIWKRESTGQYFNEMGDEYVPIGDSNYFCRKREGGQP